MRFDYFYGNEAEQFTFCRIAKLNRISTKTTMSCILK